MVLTALPAPRLSMPLKRPCPSLDSDTQDRETQDSDTLDCEPRYSDFDDKYFEPDESQSYTKLTTANLKRHTQALDPEATLVMASASQGSKGTGKSANDTKEALRNFGVDVNTKSSLPQSLLDFERDILGKTSDLTSPNAKKIGALKPFLDELNEASLVARISHLLMFQDKTDDPETGKDYIIRLNNVSFNRDLVSNQEMSLTTPIPDVGIGYGTSTYFGQDLPAAFNKEEERILSDFPIADTMLCPFLSSQFKSHKGSMETAQRQGARDGVAVNNYMLNLFKAAKMEATARDVQHWSLTGNNEMVVLWVHWAELDPNNGSYRYYMKNIHTALLGSREPGGMGLGMFDFRQYLNNILGDAQTSRVTRIKEVLAAIGKTKGSTSRSNQSSVRFYMSREDGAEDRNGSRGSDGRGGRRGGRGGGRGRGRGGGGSNTALAAVEYTGPSTRSASRRPQGQGSS
jgi:hypothetical protein